MNRKEILETAISYVTKDRAATHGSAENNFASIAGVWGWWLSTRTSGPLTAYDVACMMALFKLARMAGNPTHIDSATDLCGYAALAGEIATEAKQ